MKDFASKISPPLMQWVNVFQTFKPYARLHWRSFFFGCLAALCVVGTRLALPWPIHDMVHHSLRQLSRETTSSAVVFLPDLSSRTLIGGVFFFLLFAGHGLMDLLERLFFARFSIAIVRDIRAEVFKTCVNMDVVARTKQSGELVARLIGDTARLKAGLKGFLIHTMTNGVTFAGVCLVLLILDLRIGLIFVSAGVVAAVASISGASLTYRKAMKYRKKEGRLADVIDQVWRKNPSEARFARVNQSSGKHEAALTRIQGFSTFWTHVGFGAAIVAALWTGMKAIEQGRFEAGHLLVVIFYALLMRGAIVQLARQGAGTGSIVACASRLKQLLDAAQVEKNGEPLEGLKDRLEFVKVRVRSKKLHGVGRKRLGLLSLTISSGQKVAILGHAGSGKTTLLDVIAGYVKPITGELLWDGKNLERFPIQSRWQNISYLLQAPSWRRRSIRKFLGVPPEYSEAEPLSLLHVCKVHKIAERLPKGLDSKVGSSDLSFGECKRLAIARAFFSHASIYLLDDPVFSMSKNQAVEIIHTFLETKKDSTVLVVLSHPVAIEHFDRIIKLRRGHIVFDGTPADWLTLTHQKTNVGV
jgi:ABC-type multidrug transport system fused ATPase/permease subunit